MEETICNFLKMRMDFLFIATVNFNYVSQRAVAALFCIVTTFCLSEIIYFVPLLRHGTTGKRPGGSPLRDDPFADESSQAGWPPILEFIL